MSKGYLKSLLHYLYSVYDWGTKIKKLKDKRSNPKIATAAISFSVILGFMLKIRSFNQLDDYLEYDDFRGLVPKKIRLPRIDAIRDSLKCFCLKSLQAMHSAIIRCSIQNKFVRKATIDGFKFGLRVMVKIGFGCSNSLPPWFLLKSDRLFFLCFWALCSEYKVWINSNLCLKRMN